MEKSCRYLVDLRSLSIQERENAIEQLGCFSTTCHLVEPFVFSVVWEETKTIPDVLKIPPELVHPENG